MNLYNCYLNSAFTVTYSQVMWQHFGPRDALCEVKHGVQDLVHVAEKEGSNYCGALQCTSKGASGEWAQVQPRGGAGGHDSPGGHP